MDPDALQAGYDAYNVDNSISNKLQARRGGALRGAPRCALRAR